MKHNMSLCEQDSALHIKKRGKYRKGIYLIPQNLKDWQRFFIICTVKAFLLHEQTQKSES